MRNGSPKIFIKTHPQKVPKEMLRTASHTHLSIFLYDNSIKYTKWFSKNLYKNPSPKSPKGNVENRFAYPSINIPL